jgi:hypothetical protein
MTAPSKTLTPREMDALLIKRGISPMTMNRWSHEGLVTSPTGHARSARWPSVAFAEAVVIHHLRHELIFFKVRPEGLRRILTALRQVEAGEKPSEPDLLRDPLYKEAAQTYREALGSIP